MKIILSIILLSLCMAFFPCSGKGISLLSDNTAYTGTAGVSSAASAKIYISELSASNKTGPYDTDGERYDWLEIYNAGDAAVNLSDYRFYLSDVSGAGCSPGNIPVEPGKFALIRASEKNLAGHVNFKLSKEGGTVIITDSAGNVIDKVAYPEMDSDISYAKNALLNGGNSFALTTLITPGYENGAKGLEEYFSVRDASCGPLIINEAMSSNSTCLQTNGGFYDWVELKNNSSKDINLKNYCIADSDNPAKKYQLPDVTLRAGQLFTVIASGNERLSGKNSYHLPFKLDKDGETLFIYRPDGTVSDCAYIYIPQAETSYGRMSGKPGFYYFKSPTPGSENKNGVRSVAVAPSMSKKEGIYNDVEFLNISIAGDGDVYYTIDGSTPTVNSAKYSGTFSIRSSAVIRAVSINNGKLDSSVTTACYILNENHTLPVINIAINPNDIWSEQTGIYATGPNASDTYPFRGANYHQNWEKSAAISFFDPGGSSFSIDCGLKISGSGSRTLPKKSFQLKFRSRYGTETLDYDIFGDGIITSFKTLKLRVGEDYPLSVFRDELVTSVAAAGMPDLAVQAYRWCVLYINGKYFGLYCIREKLDEYYAAAHEKTGTDNVTVLADESYAEYGSYAEYNALLQYIRTNGINNPQVYKYVEERVNFNSLIDWAIAEIYTGNRDLSNLRLYKAGQGKWKWMLYDMDWSFYYTEKAYTLLLSNSHSERTKMLRLLLQNDNFRKLFIERVAYHMKNTFSYDKMDAKITYFTDLLSPEIERERSKWGSSYSMWIYYVGSMRNFVKTRPDSIIEQTIQYFNMTKEEAEFYFKK